MGSWGRAPPFFTSAVDGGEWSAPRPCRFTLGKTASSIHCVEAGWAPEPDRTFWRREKSLALAVNRTPFFRPPIPRPVTIPTELARLFKKGIRLVSDWTDFHSRNLPYKLFKKRKWLNHLHGRLSEMKPVYPVRNQSLYMMSAPESTF
jgi:hypothetical protein